MKTITPLLLSCVLLMGLLLSARSQAQDDGNAAVIQLIRQELESSGLLDAGDGSDEQAVQTATYMTELLRQLELRSDGLLIGLPPQNCDPARTDFRIHSDGMGRFWAEWNYNNPGDNNLDGIVDYNDVQSLLFHIWYSERPEQDMHFDGNGDGHLDIADVAVVAAHYGNCIDSYRIAGNYGPAQLPEQAGRPTRYASLAELPALIDRYRVQSSYTCELGFNEFPCGPFPGEERIWLEPLATLRGAVSSDYTGAALPQVLRSDRNCGTIDDEFNVWAHVSEPLEENWQLNWTLDGTELGDAAMSGVVAKLDEDQAVLQFTEPACHLLTMELSTPGRQFKASLPLAVFTITDNPQAEADARKYSEFVTLTSVEHRDEDYYRLPPQAREHLRKTFPGQSILSTASLELEGRLLVACVVTAGESDENSNQEASGSLYLLSSADPSGPDWTAPLNIANDVFAGVPLAQIAGRPVLAYACRTTPGADGQSGEALQYLSSRDTLGTEWNDPVTVASLSPAELGSFSPDVDYSIRPWGIHSLQGRPAMLVITANVADQHLAVIEALDDAGRSWGERQNVERTYVYSNSTIYSALAGAVDWQGHLLVLLNRVYESNMDSSDASNSYHLLAVAEPELLAGSTPDDAAVDLRKLAGAQRNPSFAADGTNEEFRLLSLDVEDTDESSTLALFSLWTKAEGDIRLRVLYSNDAQSWQMTPEFKLDESAGKAWIRSCKIIRLPEGEPGHLNNWLEIQLDVEGREGWQLWQTHLPLRSY